MRTVAFIVAGLAFAAPALADPATPAPKEKKICHAVNNGNPLFPQMKCRTVTVDSPTPQIAAASAPAAPAPADVTAENAATPH